MYDYVWLCMIMFDCMNMYDFIWLWISIYDYVWLCMTIWLCTTLHYYVKICMKKYDYVWLCISMNDYKYKLSWECHTRNSSWVGQIKSILQAGTCQIFRGGRTGRKDSQTIGYNRQIQRGGRTGWKD